MSKEPFEVFSAWFEQARRKEPADHDAVALASVDASGRPSLRMVLMREYDTRGFVFYTNLGSRKARELTENPHAAMCFHWKSTERQVRIEGAVELVDASEADRYFGSRPRESQIGAWASRQSEVLDGVLGLERRVAKYAARFGVAEIPRPPFWSGFRLRPDCFEFWDKRPFRLHERIRYVREDQTWVATRLYP